MEAVALKKSHHYMEWLLLCLYILKQKRGQKMPDLVISVKPLLRIHDPCVLLKDQPPRCCGVKVWTHIYTHDTSVPSNPTFLPPLL